MKPISISRIGRAAPYVFWVTASALAVYFFLVPGVIVIRDLAVDPIGT